MNMGAALKLFETETGLTIPRYWSRNEEGLYIHSKFMSWLDRHNRQNPHKATWIDYPETEDRKEKERKSDETFYDAKDDTSVCWGITLHTHPCKSTYPSPQDLRHLNWTRRFNEGINPIEVIVGAENIRKPWQGKLEYPLTIFQETQDSGLDEDSNYETLSRSLKSKMNEAFLSTILRKPRLIEYVPYNILLARLIPGRKRFKIRKDLGNWEDFS